MIILKVTKKQGFTLSLKNIFIKKVTGGGQIDFPAFLGLKKYWMMINTFMFEMFTDFLFEILNKTGFFYGLN